MTADDARLATAAMLTGADGITTALAATLYPDRFVELNPVAAVLLVTGAVVGMLLRIVLGLALVWAVHRLAQRPHRFPFHPMTAVVWLLSAVVIWNVAVLATA